VVNSFTGAGDPIPHFPVAGVSVQGVLTGLHFSARLILIIMLCSVVTGTTSPMRFKNVIEWYLRPVPFVPEARVATMVNLMFVLIPVIFSSFTETMNAQKSRCVELRKNPIKRISFAVIPLLTRILKRADEIAYAMEARCYSEERTRPVFYTRKIDWFISIVCLGSCALFVLIHFLF
jgi:energy-coupling factor transporter transmembrane protein EcfT